jgi:hypothetical protein
VNGNDRGMPKGRPVKAIELNKEQEEKLRLIERRPSSLQSLALRAKVILECALAFPKTQFEESGKPSV